MHPLVLASELLDLAAEPFDLAPLRAHAQGEIEEEELSVAIRQHRLAYEGYLEKLHDCLRPIAEA